MYRRRTIRGGGGWAASPTDALVPVDASANGVPTELTGQTLRMIVSPHLGGFSVRVRLANRFGSDPVAFGKVTIAKQQKGAAIGAPVQVRFGGKAGVSVPAGADVLSDAAPLTFAAFDHLAVSMLHLADGVVDFDAARVYPVTSRGKAIGAGWAAGQEWVIGQLCEW